LRSAVEQRIHENGLGDGIAPIDLLSLPFLDHR
jgi:hypothetical protein